MNDAERNPASQAKAKTISGGNGSMDREPLVEPARTAFEKKLHAKYKLRGPSWRMLDVLLWRYFWGKADCYPSNRGLMEWIPERQLRAVQLQLRRLCATGVIRMFEDRSIISQRRIVLVDHPNAPGIIASLVANPHVREMHGLGGAISSAPRGAISSAPRGAIAVAPEPLTVEPESLNQKPFRMGTENLSHLGTVNGNAVAPLPTESGLGEKEMPKPREKIPALVGLEPCPKCGKRMESMGKGTVLACARRDGCGFQISAVEFHAAAQPATAAVAVTDLEAPRPVLDPQSALIDAVRSLSRTSTEPEIGVVAVKISRALGDNHSYRYFSRVAQLVAIGRIPVTVFVDVFGANVASPKKVVTARITKLGIDLWDKSLPKALCGRPRETKGKESTK